jgi:hypothetical protein
MKMKIKQKTKLEFTIAPDVLIDKYGRLTALVWGRVWRYEQGTDGVCNASKETIAKRLKCSEASVYRSLKILIENEYLIDLTPALRNCTHDIITTNKAEIETIEAKQKRDEEREAQQGLRESYRDIGGNVKHQTITETDQSVQNDNVKHQPLTVTVSASHSDSLSISERQSEHVTMRDEDTCKIPNKIPHNIPISGVDDENNISTNDSNTNPLEQTPLEDEETSLKEEALPLEAQPHPPVPVSPLPMDPVLEEEVSEFPEIVPSESPPKWLKRSVEGEKYFNRWMEAHIDWQINCEHGNPSWACVECGSMTQEAFDLRIQMAQSAMDRYDE